MRFYNPCWKPWTWKCLAQSSSASAFAAPVKRHSHVIPRDIGIPVGIQRGPADRESWSSGLCPNQFETTSLLGIMYPRLLYNESKIWSHLIQSISLDIRSKNANNQRVYKDETCINLNHENVPVHMHICICIKIYQHDFFHCSSLSKLHKAWHPNPKSTSLCVLRPTRMTWRSIEGRASDRSIVLTINLTYTDTGT